MPAGTFLSNVAPRIADLLAERAADGVNIGLCWADPECQAVDIPEWEEGLERTLADKIRAALTYYRPLVGVPGCELRLHAVGVYASLFRFDDVLPANPHIWRAPASAIPSFSCEGSRQHVVRRLPPQLRCGLGDRYTHR